jgi:hypothetical protein
MKILWLCLLLVWVCVPVSAQEWQPDEYGAVVEMLPNPTDELVPSLSWSVVRVKELNGFATWIQPYERSGVGVDVGSRKRSQRFGAGWLEDHWLLYGRLKF